MEYADNWAKFTTLAQTAIQAINRSNRMRLANQPNWDEGRGVAEGITRGMAVIWDADPIWVENVLYRAARLERAETDMRPIWTEAAAQYANDPTPAHPAAYLENALDLHRSANWAHTD